MNIKVFPSKALGPVKPVNGVGQPPFFGVGDFPMFRYLKEAGIPFSRLHDVGGMFGRNVFVDIPNVFRDFDAEETDPDNYDFTFTDLLLNALDEAGFPDVPTCLDEWLPLVVCSHVEHSPSLCYHLNRTTERNYT